MGNRSRRASVRHRQSKDIITLIYVSIMHACIAMHTDLQTAAQHIVHPYMILLSWSLVNGELHHYTLYR